MTLLVERCAVLALMFCTVYGAPILLDEQDAVDRLVERYAPLLYLHPEERWMPGDVTTFLRHVQVQVDRETIVPLENGTLPVGPHTEDHYIIAELPTGVGTPDVKHLPFLAGSHPDTVPVYVTVTRCDPLSTNRLEAADGTRPSFHATYWIFHPFNEGKWALGQMRGNHVGDWEHVSIRVQEGELKDIFVSAHDFGAYYTYHEDTGTFNYTSQKSNSYFLSGADYPLNVELDGTHPVLYVARGSHGLWPTPAVHQYNKVPALVDVTATGGAEWRTWRQIVSLARAQPHWLQFAGRWGNPPDCANLVKAYCQLNSGPPGVAGRAADLQCTGRPERRSWWRRLFGRRRRRRAVAAGSKPQFR